MSTLLDPVAGTATGVPAGEGLRVLVLNNERPPLGGAEAHVQALCDVLRDAGHAVEPYAPGPARGWRAWRDRFHNPDAARWLRRRIAEVRPDLVHVHNFMRRLSPAPLRVARAAGVPVVLTVHDFQLFCPRTWAVRADGSPCARPVLARCIAGGCRGAERGFARLQYPLTALRRLWVVREVRRHADAVVAPSAALADRLRLVLRRDVHVLANPFPDVEPYVAPPSHHLLFLGRLAPEKGVRELLHALAAVRDECDLQLTIAGDGAARGELEALTVALDLQARVRFTGWVDREQARQLLSAHGALVLPSVCQESNGLVVHEAFAAGRPVLGSARGGIPELIDDGTHGFLFDPYDRQAFAHALRRWAAASGAVQQAMGRAARARAAAARGRAGFAARVLDVYRTVLAARGSGR